MQYLTPPKISSLVIEHLSAQYELSNKTRFCFVYCNYKEPHETTTYIKALMKQLLRSTDEVLPELDTIFQNDRKPGYGELQLVLLKLFQRFENVFLVLDALDECSVDQRAEILDVLRGLVSPGSSHRGNVKLFVTSREESDIKRGLKHFPMIQIEAKKVDKDIESYVVSQMDDYLTNGNLSIDATLQDKIRTTLVSKAGGM